MTQFCTERFFVPKVENWKHEMWLDYIVGFIVLSAIKGGVNGKR